MIVKGTVHPKIELFQPCWGAAAAMTPPLTPSPTRCTYAATEGAAALEVAKGSECPQKDVKRIGRVRTLQRQKQFLEPEDKRKASSDSQRRMRMINSLCSGEVCVEVCVRAEVGGGVIS